MRVLRSHYLQLHQGEGIDNPASLAPHQQAGDSISSNLIETINTMRPDPSCSSYVEINSPPTISNESLLNQKIVTRRYSQSQFTTTPQKLYNTTNYETFSYSEYRNLSITLRNIPQHIKVKVHVHPVDMDNRWLTRIYRSYENDLWQKRPREPDSRYKKWYFKCLLCHRTLRAFDTIKCHLNGHLKLYPFVCKLCGKPHTNRKEAVKHIKKVHYITKYFKLFIGN